MKRRRVPFCGWLLDHGKGVFAAAWPYWRGPILAALKDGSLNRESSFDEVNGVMGDAGDFWVAKECWQKHKGAELGEGYVYFTQILIDWPGPGVVRGPIKIGYSLDVADRHSSLRTALPFDLECLLALPAQKPSDERTHQRLFRKDHLRREWYLPSRALLTYIANHQPGAT